MKPNKFGKKLVLSRKTVANLDHLEMQRIEGGATFIRCDSIAYPNTCNTICCPIPMSEVPEDCQTDGCLSNKTQCWSDPYGPAC
jgi:hypothetical protein